MHQFLIRLLAILLLVIAIICLVIDGILAWRKGKESRVEEGKVVESSQNGEKHYETTPFDCV
jgi:FtsZ-interacting cell division protein ZipA